MCNACLIIVVVKFSLFPPSLSLSLSLSLSPHRFSGLTSEDMVGVETSLDQVQQQLLSMIHSDTILIGHSLESDLRALKVRKLTHSPSHP